MCFASETNLKVRQSLVQTGEMADDVNAFSSFAGMQVFLGFF